MPKDSDKEPNNNSNQGSAVEEKDTKIAKALTVLLLLALVGFSAYRYFNKPATVGETNQNQQALENSGSQGEIISGKTQRAEVAGTATSVASGSATKWVATDYQKGDIKSGTYTVKTGDTLWEVSEAVYGDGAQWGKILDANSSQIGYLPNGEHALIIAGQVIQIP